MISDPGFTAGDVVWFWQGGGTDERGLYTLSGLQPGSHRVSAFADGYSPETIAFVTVGRSDADFALSEGGLLRPLGERPSARGGGVGRSRKR